jgi:carbamoylphosphate synthase large subunit
MVFVLPSLKSFQTASDKGSTYTLALELSIPTIETFSEENFGKVVYPAVVKNRHSIVWKDKESISGSATFVFSKQELDATYARIKKETAEAPLVQTFIRGEEYGVTMVCETGLLLATSVHKRIRSLSPRGGAAVVKETAKETAEVSLMRAYAHALVKKLEWHGPVMVEFKIDDESGRVLLMEINGRFVGSLPLAVKAGLDFPVMVYQLGMGNTVAKMPEAFLPPYVRTRHFLGDCKWLLSVFFKNDPLRSFLYPSRWRALWDFKKEIFISRGDIFAWNDLKPSIMEYVDHIRSVFK